MSKSYKIILFGVILLAGALLSYFFLFSAPQREAEEGRFVVPLDAAQSDAVKKLADEGFIKSARAFGLIAPEIEPGGYRLSKDMNAFEVASALEDTYMKWVVIPEGFRKEQIAEKMAGILGWSDEQVARFIEKDTALPDAAEGVFFPDTYLIPLDEGTADVAKRLNRRFNEVFGPYAKEALEKDISWLTVIKLASLIQRETGGGDMSLIAGVLWNRLDIGMKLQVDATLQYAKGKTEEGWWGKVTAEDKKIDSPYNSYLHAGLPPRPIANPGLNAIRAALNPEETECLFYLHDRSRKIYCAVTFEEHKENIEKYLR
jgi:UPF0755 protein